MEEKETKQKNINFKQKTKENKKIKDKNENIMEEYTKEIKEETKKNIIQKQPDNKAKDTLEKDVETYDNNVKSKKKNIKIVNTYENLKKKAKKLNNKISAKININKIISKIDEKLEINKLKFNTLEMILLIIVAFVFGILISESFIYANLKQDKKETEQNITDIENIYNTIINEYYEDLDKNNLKEAAINGMLGYLKDGYTVYFDDKETEQFNELVDGQYYGLGIEMTLVDNEYPYVSKVFENTPAFDADIKVNDKIIKVEGKDVKGQTLNDISSLIKGNDNKTVKIVIERDNETIEKTLTTKKIDIQSVTSSILSKDSKKIGYIKISIFALNTGEQFIKELASLEKNNIDGLIIDVRNNVGGHLTTVKQILNVFFTPKEPLYKIDRKGKIETTYGTLKEEDVKQYQNNIVVLVNGNSASGSEILASAFKEVKKSQIIGTTTFGKGTVQKVIELKDGGTLKITSETWLTAMGNTINKVGITPTMEVKQGEEYFNNSTFENDIQLQQALDNVVK